MADNHSVNEEGMKLIRDLVEINGLRPMIEAVVAVTRDLHKDGVPIWDSQGVAMSTVDIASATGNLKYGGYHG